MAVAAIQASAEFITRPAAFRSLRRRAHTSASSGPVQTISYCSIWRVFGVNYSGRSTTIILAGPASRIQDDDACARTAAGEIDAGRGCCDDAGVRLGKVAGIEEGALDADEQRIEPLGPGTRLAKYASEYGNVATR